MMFRKLMLSVVISVLGYMPIHALTGGPMQPEFASFEPVDVTDLVNLSSGNFTYVIPLGEVKGPAGVGYPIALSYHAGIQHEQEASWVGLGWTLNAGAISRILRGTADDANDDVIISYLWKEGEDGWGFNIGGGFGPVSATVGWTNQGFQGITSIGIGYNIGFVNAGINVNPAAGTFGASIGAGAQIGNGPSAGASVGITTNMKTGETNYFGSVGLSCDGVSLGGFSIDSKGSTGFSMAGASASASSFTDDGVFSTSGGFGLTIPITPLIRVDFSFSSWGWHYSQQSESKNNGYLVGAGLDYLGLYTNNPIKLKYIPEQKTYNSDYGISKPKEASILTTEAKLECIRGERDTLHHFPSQDYYNVSAQGITGTFKPISFKPTVAVKRNDKDDQYFSEDNPYLQKAGLDAVDGITFKMINETAMNMCDDMDESLDAEFKSYDFKMIDYTVKNIDENGDLENFPARGYGTRIEPIFGGSWTASKNSRLTGFVITDLQGKTYYYTIPLFGWGTVGYVSSSDEIPLNILKGDKYAREYSYRYDPNGYATSWLLTAITGPDYVKKVIDLNGNQINAWDEAIRPHQGDWGYWVSLRYEYGRSIAFDEKSGKPEFVEDTKINGLYNESPKANYLWREPYEKTKVLKRGVDNIRHSVTMGFKELTYLKSIETSSEIAFFRTSPRYDGIGLNKGAVYPETVRSKLNIGNVNENVFNINPNGMKKIVDPPADKDDFSRQMAEIVPKTWPEQSAMSAFRIKFNCDNIPSQFNLGDIVADVSVEATARYVLNGEAEVIDNIRKSKSVCSTMPIVYDSYGWDLDGENNPIPAGGNGWSNPNWDELRQMGPQAKTVYLKITERYGRIDFVNYLFGEYFDYTQESERFCNLIKCFHITRTGNEIELYCISYKIQFADYLNLSSVETATNFFEAYRWTNASVPGKGDDHLLQFDDIHVKDASLLIYNHETFSQNIASLFQKKLDEIAWYSKAEYPNISSMYDYGDEGAKKFFPWENKLPYPQSSRRVKFYYDYSLAKKTPNSKADTKGRLTLKQVQMEAGAESQSIVNPPYLFKYQNADKEYLGYGKEDKWGFRLNDEEKEGGSVYSDNKVGVNWNLSEIVLPSCGKITVDYERDQLPPNLGALHRIREIAENKEDAICDKSYRIETDYQKSPKKKIANQPPVWLINPDNSGMADLKVIGMVDPNELNVEPNHPYLKVTIPQGSKIEEGWIFYLVYTFRKDDGNKISEWHFNESVYFPLRVDKIIAHEVGTNTYTIRPDKNIAYFHTECAKTYPLKSSYNFLKGGTIGGTETPPRAHFLIPRQLFGDNIRVTKIASTTLGKTMSTLYSYPEKGGDLTELPEEAKPWIFYKTAGSVSDIEDRYFFETGLLSAHWTPVKNRRILYFHNIPEFDEEHGGYEAGTIDNYASGSNTLIYPWVEVKQDAPNSGKVRYQFYTGQDKHVTTINGTQTKVFEAISKPVKNLSGAFITAHTPFKEFTGDNLDVSYKAIIDRSQIIGQTKAIEYFNADGKMVKKSEVEYGYGDQLSGVFYDKEPVTPERSKSPLGFIREHVFTRIEDKDAKDHKIKALAVTDLMTYTPFKVRQKDVLDSMIVTKEFGVFNAYTGEPMVVTDKVVTPSQGEDVVRCRTNINVPYVFYATSDKAEQLRNKNMYSTEGLSVTTEQDMLSSTSYTNLSQLLSSEFNGTVDHILKADANVYTQEDVVSDEDSYLPSFQTRFYKSKTFSWLGRPEGADFNFTEDVIQDNSQWQKNSEVINNDLYNRPLCVRNANEIPVTTLYQPYGNMVTTLANSVLPENIAVFTCDYDDYNDAIDDGWFDKTNGWRRSVKAGGALGLETEVRHFGEHSLHVQNSWGPQKDIVPVYELVDNKQIVSSDYTFSAWVYARTTDPIQVRIQKVTVAANGQRTLSGPIHITLEGMQVGQWKKASIVIGKEDLSLIDINKIEVAIGSDNNVDFNVDDIRFHPVKTLVNTFYYNQALQKPITFVDENDQAKYFVYEPFGRLVEKGVFKN